MVSRHTRKSKWQCSRNYAKPCMQNPVIEKHPYIRLAPVEVHHPARIFSVNYNAHVHRFVLNTPYLEDRTLQTTGMSCRINWTVKTPSLKTVASRLLNQDFLKRFTWINLESFQPRTFENEFQLAGQYWWHIISKKVSNIHWVVGITNQREYSNRLL